jgi:hypothetical protein
MKSFSLFSKRLLRDRYEAQQAAVGLLRLKEQSNSEERHRILP